MAAAPFVFVDRSLGRVQVPRLLRAAGINLVTLAEHYGRPAEQQAIITSSARCFCLSSGNLGFESMAERYIRNWPAIARASASVGPFLYSVRADTIERLPISRPS